MDTTQKTLIDRLVKLARNLEYAAGTGAYTPKSTYTAQSTATPGAAPKPQTFWQNHKPGAGLKNFNDQSNLQSAFKFPSSGPQSGTATPMPAFKDTNTPSPAARPLDKTVGGLVDDAVGSTSTASMLPGLAAAAYAAPSYAAHVAKNWWSGGSAPYNAPASVRLFNNGVAPLANAAKTVSNYIPGMAPLTAPIQTINAVRQIAGAQPLLNAAPTAATKSNLALTGGAALASGAYHGLRGLADGQYFDRMDARQRADQMNTHGHGWGNYIGGTLYNGLTNAMQLDMGDGLAQVDNDLRNVYRAAPWQARAASNPQIFAADQARQFIERQLRAPAVQQPSQYTASDTRQYAPF